MPPSPFSKRHGYTGQPKEIAIQEDAPETLRRFVLQTADESGLGPSDIRDITCAVLELRPDNNWSGSYIWDEAQRHVYGCEWFKVYDIIERIWKYLKNTALAARQHQHLSKPSTISLWKKVSVGN
jgi:hypothetical protein